MKPTRLGRLRVEAGTSLQTEHRKRWFQGEGGALGQLLLLLHRCGLGGLVSEVPGVFLAVVT